MPASHFVKAALEADPQVEQYWLSYISALIQAVHYEDAELVLSYDIEASLSGPAVEFFAIVLENRLTQISQPSASVGNVLMEMFSEQRYDEI